MNKKKIVIIILLIIFNIFFISNIFIIADYLQLAKFNYRVMPIENNDILHITNRFEQNLLFDNKKRPIVIMGCSYAFGTNLKDDETLAYKLQEVSNRKVYNYAFPGHSIQHVLYKLQNSPLFNEKLNPEYIIYVFMGDHLSRIYRNYFNFNDTMKYLKYEKKNGKLEPIPFKVSLNDKIKVTYLAKKFNNYSYSKKSEDKKFDVLKEYLKLAKETIDKKYKNTKFVVIVYNSELDSHGFKPFHTNRWNELEEEGIEVINFDIKEYDFLLNREYRNFDIIHPSGKAWDVLTPIIAKRLNLIEEN